MIRHLTWVVPVVALAACGGGEAEKNKAAERAAALKSGQYEITTEVTAFRAADKGAPKIDTPQGTRATRTVCISDSASLPTDLFADEGFQCEQGAGAYIKDGTVNTNLSCRREGLNGPISYSVTGSFQAESFEVERVLASSLLTDGDVVINSTARGRRTGECTAAPPAGGNGQGNAAKQ